MGITQKTEAVGMYSAEGEYVEFGHSVLLEGPVEVRPPRIIFRFSISEHSAIKSETRIRCWFMLHTVNISFTPDVAREPHRNYT